MAKMEEQMTTNAERPEAEQTADLLLREEEGFERLKASIEEHHVLVPVVACFNTGEIVDGRLRMRVCRELGLEPAINWQWFADDADREAMRRALNLARQHLGPAARDAWEGGG